MLPSTSVSSVERFVAKGDMSDARTIVKDVGSGDLGLLEVVELLGPGISSASDDDRYRATDLLSIVLHSLGPISENEVKFLSQFLRDRLHDVFTLTPVASAILALATRQPAFKGCIVDTVKDIFSTIAVQSSVLDARKHLLEFFLYLVQNHVDVLKDYFKDTFVLHTIQQVDGEKDPRCLVLVFDLVAAVVRSFNISEYADDLFDVTSCYFPITFSPPAGDKIGIKREDLLYRLRECFIASKLFAPMFYDLVMEKLSTTTDDIKIQCYETLGYCVDKYGDTSAIKPYLKQMYGQMRSELFQSFDASIKKASMQCCTAVCASLAQTAQPVAAGPPSVLGEFLEPIISEGVRHLSDFDVGFIKVQTQLLAAAAASSPVAADIVVSNYFSAVFEKNSADPSSDHRLAFLASLHGILGAIKTRRPADDIATAAVPRDVCVQLLQMVRGAFGRAETAAALDVLGAAVALRWLGEEEVVDVAPTVLHMVLTGNVGDGAAPMATALDDDTKNNIQRSGINACRAIMHTYKDVGSQTILPVLSDKMQSVTYRDPTGDTELSVTAEAKALHEIVRKITVHADGAIVLIRAAMEVLARTCAASDVGSGEGSAPSLDAATRASVSTSTLRNLCALGHVEAETIAATVVRPLFALYVQANTARSAAPAVGSDALCTSVLHRSDVLANVVGVVRQCGRLLSTSSQQALFADTLAVLGDQGDKNADVCVHGPLLTLGATLVETARRDTIEPARATALARALVHHAAIFTSVAATEAAVIAVSAVCNKLPDADDAVHQVHAPCIAELDDAMGRVRASSPADSALVAEGVARCKAWMHKALFLRGHPTTATLTQALVAQLGARGGDGRRCAEAFAVLASDDDDAGLSAASHGTVAFMYKQRMFLAYLPALVTTFQDGAPHTKANVLTALAHLLATLPKQVLLDEVHTVWPLLVDALGHPDGPVVQAVLGVVLVLLTEAQEKIDTHAATLVRLLLPLCGATKMAVRVAAIQGLSALAQLPSQKVYPLATRVIQGLVPVLDDKKRIVREHAVRCRSAWYLLNSP
eukprot:m.33009 g.33009  ORF g.33009 m.33009 type:complete len:1046 (-) comp14189_c0_seq1:56-3193(-)